jgi:peptidoglycan/LPS O-acetylase OafA/YrhL
VSLESAEETLPSDSAGKHSLHGLEILRFLAAFAVIVYHYPDYFLADRASDELLPFAQGFRVFYQFGHYAVPVFWTLSGYIFFWKYHTDIAKGTLSALRFGVLRFSRLYPLHLLTLAFVVALYCGSICIFRDNSLPFYDMGLGQLVTQILFASNWFSPRYTFNGPIWSVSVELLIYALFFILARSGRLNPLRFLLCVLAASGASYWIACRIAPGSALVNILWCSACFFLGALMSHGREALHRHFIAAAAILVLVTALLMYFRPTYAWEFALPATGVFLFAERRLWNSGLVRHVSFAGNLTYGSYLLHFPLAVTMLMMLKALQISSEVAFSQTFFVLYASLVFGTAAAVYLVFERPTQDLLRRIGRC